MRVINNTKIQLYIKFASLEKSAIISRLLPHELERREFDHLYGKQFYDPKQWHASKQESWPKYKKFISEGEEALKLKETDPKKYQHWQQTAKNVEDILGEHMHKYKVQFGTGMHGGGDQEGWSQGILSFADPGDPAALHEARHGYQFHQEKPKFYEAPKGKEDRGVNWYRAKMLKREFDANKAVMPYLDIEGKTNLATAFDTYMTNMGPASTQRFTKKDYDWGPAAHLEKLEEGQGHVSGYTKAVEKTEPKIEALSEKYQAAKDLIKKETRQKDRQLTELYRIEDKLQYEPKRKLGEKMRNILKEKSRRLNENIPHEDLDKQYKKLEGRYKKISDVYKYKDKQYYKESERLDRENQIKQIDLDIEKLEKEQELRKPLYKLQRKSESPEMTAKAYQSMEPEFQQGIKKMVSKDLKSYGKHFGSDVKRNIAKKLRETYFDTGLLPKPKLKGVRL